MSSHLHALHVRESVVVATRRVVIALCVAAVVALAPALRLSAQSNDSLVPKAAPFRCLDTSATIAPARLDARHLIYVEQQTVVGQKDGRVLVAGNPVFVWRDRGNGFDLLARDSLLGMVVDTGALVRGIPSPLPGRRLDAVRAAAMADGWWLVAFAEVVPPEGSATPAVIAMWTGETDGTNWRGLRQLPLIADSLNAPFTSQLAWRDGRARLVVPFQRDHNRGVVLYSLNESRWSATKHDVGPLSYAAVTLSPTHDIMAVVRPAMDTLVDINSLFLYAKPPSDTSWSTVTRVLRAGLDPVRDPLFSTDGGVLTWRRLRPAIGGREAWFTMVNSRGDSVGTLNHIARDAEELKMSRTGDAVMWAIYDRKWPDPTLQLFERSGADEVTRYARITRYRGLLGLAIARNRAVVVGSLAAESPRDPAVVSIIETHTWRCLSRSSDHEAQHTPTQGAHENMASYRNWSRSSLQLGVRRIRHPSDAAVIGRDTRPRRAGRWTEPSDLDRLADTSSERASGVSALYVDRRPR
ncbi:MAG: hypothetical protein K0S86_4338 [Geminicoccaceae bacterium]|nr:hypothetical protein [Geminicoccaceae bacterium]